MPYPSNDGPDDLDDRTHLASRDQLRSFVERIERLEIEKTDIAEAVKEVYAEAKGRGYDVKVMRKLIRERKRDASAVAEEEAVMGLYREILNDV